MVSECILAVDDDPTILAVYEEVFGQAGFEVKVADRGYSAIPLVRAQPFDLALTSSD